MTLGMDVEELRRPPARPGERDGPRAPPHARRGLEAEEGQVLALQDDPGAGMFILCDGTVAVELRSGTLELGPGDFFGELALLVDDGARVARVRRPP